MLSVNLINYPLIKNCMGASVMGAALYHGLKVTHLNKDLRLVIAMSSSVLYVVISLWEQQVSSLSLQLDDTKKNRIEEKSKLLNYEDKLNKIKKKLQDTETNFDEEFLKLKNASEDLKKQNQNFKIAHTEFQEKIEALLSQNKELVLDIKQQAQNYTFLTQMERSTQKELRVQVKKQKDDLDDKESIIGNLRLRIDEIRKEKTEQKDALEAQIERTDRERAQLQDQIAQTNFKKFKEQINNSNSSISLSKQEENSNSNPVHHNQNSCSIKVVSELPEKQDSSTVFITQADWTTLIENSPFFKAYDNNPTLDRTIGHSKDVVSFSVRYLLSKAEADCQIWKEKMENPILRRLMTSDDWTVFGDLEAQVKEQIELAVGEYLEQIFAYMNFALQIQSKPWSVLESYSNPIEFWQKRILDIKPLIDGDLLTTLVRLCNTHSNTVSPLRILEDLCLTKIHELNINSEPPLSMSLIRIGRQSYFWVDSDYVNSDVIIKLIQNKSITLAETTLIDFADDDHNILPKSDEVLTKIILEDKNATTSFLFYADMDNLEKALNIFQSTQFPFMCILKYARKGQEYRDKWVSLLQKHLNSSELNWSFSFTAGDRIVICREGDEKKCDELHPIYFYHHHANHKWYSIKDLK